MKRILRMGSLSLAVSMLFTGCGSSGLVNGLVGGYEEIAWDIIETDANREQWGQAGLTEGETMAPIELPDYYEQTEQEKTGKQPRPGGQRAAQTDYRGSSGIGDCCIYPHRFAAVQADGDGV